MSSRGESVRYLAALLSEDERRMAAIRLVRELELPQGAIAGEFVRCAVFDALHKHPEATQLRSLDVVYFDPERTDLSVDESLELELMAQASRRPWRVRNLAREGASSFEEALGAAYHDTASAVAVRVKGREKFDVVSPFGLNDLLSGIVRPVGPERAGALRRQVREEKWRARYPELDILD